MSITKTLTPGSKDWSRFCRILSGKKYCNFRHEKNDTLWDCDNTLDKSIAILEKHFGYYDVKSTIEGFKKRGGYCDCEVLFNVDR